MGLYHPLRVIKVLKKEKDVTASDESVQVLTESWDELQWTVSVDPKLSDKVSEGDIVLADWTTGSETKVPAMAVIKVLKGKKGDDVWKVYKEYLKKQKAKKDHTQAQQTYMG